MACLSDIPNIQIGRRATEKHVPGDSRGVTAVKSSSSSKASTLLPFGDDEPRPRTSSKDAPDKRVTRTGGLSRSASGSGLTAVRTMSRTQSPAATPRAAGASSPKSPRPADNMCSLAPIHGVTSRSQSVSATPRAASASSPKSPRPADKAVSHAKLPRDLPKVAGNDCDRPASSSPNNGCNRDFLVAKAHAQLRIPGRRSHSSSLPELPALSPRASSDIGCYVTGWSDSCTETPRSDVAATPRLGTDDLLKPNVGFLTRSERRASLAKAQSDTDSCSSSSEDEVDLEFEMSEEVKALKQAYTREPKSMWALVNKSVLPKRRLNIAEQRHIQRQMLLRTAENEAAEKDRQRQRKRMLGGLN